MNEPAELARKLKSEGDKLAAFFDSLDASQWMTEVYTEGSIWTIRNILAHLVTAEQGFIKLFTMICEGGAGVPEDFDIDRFNARQQEKTRDASSAELLDQFRAVRAEMIAFVDRLQAGDLEREGRHAFLGPSSLREMIKMVYLHNQIHYRDLKKVLQKSNASDQ